MTIPVKRLKNGFALPVLGFGTWRMGGDTERQAGHDEAADRAALEMAIQAGMRHFDTAELYAQGRAEELLADALEGQKREEFVIASKVWRDNLHYQAVKDAARRSLERLRTSYIDLYYIHAANPEIPLGETVRAFNELVEEGLVKHVAVSNFAVPRMQEFQRYSHFPLVANQVHFNLKFRECETHGVLAYCQQQDIFCVAWRPLQYGELVSGEVPEILKELAQKYGKTPAEVALQWLVAQPNVTTLVKTLKSNHLAENISAVSWQMEARDVEHLRDAYPGQVKVSDRMPLM